MPPRHKPECVADAFDLYVKYNGENLPAIQKEMREKGWVKFTSQSIRKKVKGEFTGWEADLNWKGALKEINANRGKAAMTSAEELHSEVEVIRKSVFETLQRLGVNDPENKWLLWEHGKYVEKTANILKDLEGARDNFANYVFFLRHLLAAATKISPDLARMLCESEEALLDWGEKKWVRATEGE